VAAASGRKLVLSSRSWCMFIGASLWMLVYTLALKPKPSLLGLLTMPVAASYTTGCFATVMARVETAQGIRANGERTSEPPAGCG